TRRSPWPGSPATGWRPAKDAGAMRGLDVGIHDQLNFNSSARSRSPGRRPPSPARPLAPRRVDGRKTAHPPNMADERIRRQIAFLAAQMMYHRTESEYFTAKRKAARQLGVEYRHRPGDLPSNKEIRDQIQAMARVHEGPKRLDHLRDMR